MSEREHQKDLELCNRATARPWEFVEYKFRGGYSGIVNDANVEVLFPNHCNDGDDGDAWFEDFPSEADRNFILFACNNIEAYIIAYEKSEAQAAVMRGALEKILPMEKMSNGSLTKSGKIAKEALESSTAGQDLLDSIKAQGKEWASLNESFRQLTDAVNITITNQSKTILAQDEEITLRDSLLNDVLNYLPDCYEVTDNLTKRIEAVLAGESCTTSQD